MVDQTRKTKAAILRELESIQSLLGEQEEDIPVLEDRVEPEPPADKKQPSLFDAPQSTEPLAKGQGENPFLPKHIRDRLASNRQTSRPANAEKNKREEKVSKQTTALSRERLIEELLDSFVPEVESELRQRLEKLTDEQLKSLLKSSDR